MDAASTPATDAQARADGSLARPKVTKFAADPILAAHVSERLEAKDSPMTISIELARGVHGICAAVSHETIYQVVYAHGRRGLPAGLHTGLHTGLHRRRRCRNTGCSDPKRPNRTRSACST